MSRINYKFYTLKDQQSIESFINLRNAIRYSNRLPDSSFIIWKDSLQNSLKNFLYINNDTLNTNGLIKKALNFYTESYSDTLDIYFVYYPKETNEIIINNFDESNEIDSLRYKILSIASQQEGIPYKYAGEKPETGFDCSGFTKYVYSSIGVDLPHNAQKQSDIKVGKINLEDAREGDLIFFGYADDKKHYTQHAGIIFSIDNDKVKVIHCVSNGVSIDGDNSSWSHYWKDRVLFVKSMESIIQNSK